MAEELDRKIMPEFMQMAFAVSLGACYKSFEMMKSPQSSAEKLFDEMKQMLTLPDNAGDGLQKKAEAVAAVWMEKGAGLVEVCKTEGEKFTEEGK
ncbi:MAG: hypothetical protein IPM24_01220 [Bryobacterales bacterium]|jgi:hypothetical protein|nr:hypothetical protein [Bryobacterales bacterium]